MFSSISGGILADKFIKKNPRTYSDICMWGSLLGWVPFTLSVLLTGNFWVSIAMTAGKYILGENHWSPNMTLL